MKLFCESPIQDDVFEPQIRVYSYCKQGIIKKKSGAGESLTESLGQEKM